MSPHEKAQNPATTNLTEPEEKPPRSPQIREANGCEIRAGPVAGSGPRPSSIPFPAPVCPLASNQEGRVVNKGGGFERVSEWALGPF